MTSSSPDDAPLGEDTLATPAATPEGSAGVHLKPGTRVAGYVIEEEIGRGGMGVVYRALEPDLERIIALKLMLPSLSNDPDFRTRFASETKVVASLESPHVLPVYRAGEADERLFMAMPLVKDGDLGSRLIDGPLKSAEEAALALAQLAEVLDAAHEKGLVHRDVKPGNVLIELEQDRITEVYLADFGLSKAYSVTEDFTLTGGMIGSPEYMSPEQIAGDTVGPASDQYALACLAARMLYGFSPFKRDNRAATLLAHIQDEPTWPVERVRAAKPPIKRVLDRALAKDPEKRFGSCTEFTRELISVLPDAGPLHRLRPRIPVSIAGARSRRVFRRSLFVSGLLLILTLLMVSTPVRDIILPPRTTYIAVAWNSIEKVFIRTDESGKPETVSADEIPELIRQAARHDASEKTTSVPVESTASGSVAEPNSMSVNSVVESQNDRRVSQTVSIKSFRSPSKNIACYLDVKYARCDISDRVWDSPPKPKNCKLDWANGLMIEGRKAGRMLCAGDTVLNPDAPKLEYGTASKVGLFRCVSQESGMTCENTGTGHGFFLSRNSYEVF